MWLKLERLYMSKSLAKSLAKRRYTKRRPNSFAMKEGEPVKERLDKFYKINMDLETIDVKLENKDKSLILLSSLTESYEHFFDTLLPGRDTLSMDGVKSAQLTEKKEVKDGKEKQQSRSKSKNKKRKCFFCRKEGHLIKDRNEQKALEKMKQKTAIK